MSITPYPTGYGTIHDAAIKFGISHWSLVQIIRDGLVSEQVFSGIGNLVNYDDVAAAINNLRAGGWNE